MDQVYIKKTDLSEWTQKYFKEDLVSVDDLIRVIEDLNNEVDSIKEEFNDYKRMVEDNYKPKSMWEQTGMSEKDFH